MCISNDEKFCLNYLYIEKCELNQLIKENTNDNKLKMIPIAIHKYFSHPLYEITVRRYL